MMLQEMLTLFALYDLYLTNTAHENN